MTSSLFTTYGLVRKMLSDYRGYDIESKEVTRKEFTTLIQLDRFVRVNAKTKGGRQVVVFILGKTKDFSKKEGFLRLLRKVKTMVADVIFITDEPFSTYIDKTIDEQPETLRIFNYMRKHFLLEISKVPFACKHEIMTPQEVRQVIMQDLMVSPLSLPVIYADDPAMVWMGGNVGQVVRITADSLLVGKTVKYRVVFPRPGKITSVNEKNEANDHQTSA